MMRIAFQCSIVTAMLLANSRSVAQTNETPGSAAGEFEPAPPPKLNKVSLSYRMGLNMKVDFKNLGGLQLSDPGPATGSAYNRNYDNGYNRVDISGNHDDLTWYWGYENDLSHQGSTLTLQSESTPPTAASGQYQDHPQSGVELSYSREFSRGKRWRLGLEGAFGYTAISIQDEQTLNYFVNRTSDSFGLGPVIPPLPPYAGTYAGPGPLISSSLAPGDRSVTTLNSAATILGERRVDSDVFTLRIGPYLEVPLNRKFSLNFGGGFTLAWADTQFSFRETVMISDPLYNINLTSTLRSGSGSETDFLIGGYAGAGLSYAISDQVGVFAGAMFQAAGNAVNKENGKQSVLNLGQSVIVSIGASYSF
jgi:hypothetical protein